MHIILSTLLVASIAVYFAIFARFTATYLWLLFLPLTVSSPILASLLGTPDNSFFQKLWVLIMWAVLFAVLGQARWDWAGFFVVVLFFFFFAVTIVNSEILNAFDAARGFFGYILPYLFLFLGWRKYSPYHGFRIIALLPLVAVAVGVVLHVLGITELFKREYTGTLRLTGGLFVAYMAAFGMFGVFAAVVLYLRRARFSVFLIVSNLLITILTVTRGPIIVSALLLVTLLFLPTNTTSTRRIPIAGRIFIAFIIFLSSAVGAPAILERFLGAGTSQGILSGRSIAWTYFFEIAQESPIFGHGVGASSFFALSSPIESVREYFVAPHNTYLQLFVDVGAVGLFLILLLTVRIAHIATRSLPQGERIIAVMFFLGLGFYAFFDNLLSTVQPAVLFGFVLSLLCGASLLNSATVNDEPRLTQKRVVI